MNAITDSVTLIKVETSGNHNKFYRVELDDAGAVTATWGRVGASGQSQRKGLGRGCFDRCVRAKESKGYRKVDLVDSPTSTPSRGAASKAALRAASLAGLAAPGFADDPRLTALIDRLVELNAHELLAASGGKISVVDGQVTTPLGLLTSRAIDEAAALLDRMEDETALPLRDRILEEYLTLVPQKVGAHAGWQEAFYVPAAYDRQRTLLGQLRDSVEFATKQAASVQPENDVPANLFRMKLGVVEPNDARFKQVEAFYSRSANPSHRAVAGLKVKHVYTMADAAREPLFAAAASAKGNVRQAWHGTRAFNVLSILSGGYKVPPKNARGVTDRMFGDGVYFSEQSTKSLNYAKGVWAGTRDRGSCFMVLNDVVTGWQFRPDHHRHDWPAIMAGRQTDTDGRRFDSIYVKAGTAGVANHECIVWNLDQIGVRYLVEFA